MTLPISSQAKFTIGNQKPGETKRTDPVIMETMIDHELRDRDLSLTPSFCHCGDHTAAVGLRGL